MFRARRHLLGIGATTVLMASLLATPAGAQSGFTCDGLQATIVGTPGDDVLNGTPGPDVIVGLQGDDTIHGMGGDDTVCAGQGDDMILGGAGFDVIFAAQGNDLIYACLLYTSPSPRDRG